MGMEMFSAADEEQWDIITRAIDQSDYYVSWSRTDTAQLLKMGLATPRRNTGTRDVSDSHAWLHGGDLVSAWRCR